MLWASASESALTTKPFGTLPLPCRGFRETPAVQCPPGGGLCAQQPPWNYTWSVVRKFKAPGVSRPETHVTFSLCRSLLPWGGVFMTVTVPPPRVSGLRALVCFSKLREPDRAPAPTGIPVPSALHVSVLLQSFSGSAGGRARWWRSGWLAGPAWPPQHTSEQGGERTTARSGFGFEPTPSKSPPHRRRPASPPAS